MKKHIINMRACALILLSSHCFAADAPKPEDPALNAARAEIAQLRQYIADQAAWQTKQMAVMNAAVTTCLGTPPAVPPSPKPAPSKDAK